MRKLTFQGFLRQYVRDLSYTNAIGVTVLAKETEHNRRLVEPLFCYSVLTGQIQQTMRAIPKEIKKEYSELLMELENKDLVSLFSEENDVLPKEYQKVWEAYQVRINSVVADDRAKTAARNQILSLQKKKLFSTYRLYKTLDMNGGNVNAWLKYGDNKKVSCDAAFNMLKLTRAL